MDLPADLDAFHAVLRRRIRDQSAIDACHAQHQAKAAVSAEGRAHVVGQTGCFCLDCLVHRKQEWRVGDVNTAIAGPRDRWVQYAWGDALGVAPVVTPRVRETIVVRDAKQRALRIQRDAKFTAVASGKRHTLMLSESGGVFACGDNAYGALAQPESVVEDASPLRVPLSVGRGECRVSQITASAFACFALVVVPPTDAPLPRPTSSRPAFGRLRSMADMRNQLKQDEPICNHLVSWGRGHHGVLGHGDTASRRTPTTIDVFNSRRVVHVSAGAQHVLVLTEAHGVFAFGDGGHGKLGLGDTDDRLSPAPLLALDGLHILHVSAGDDHSIAVTGDVAVNRQVYSWGRGDNGRLGHNDDQPRLKPTRINHFRGRKVTSVVAGGAHNLALSEMPDGVCVWSWGAGTYGQLGHRETWDAWLPRSIDEIRRESIHFIDAGERHSLAISDSRRLWLWGKGVHGEQEVATPDPTSTCMVQPIVVELPGIQIISAKAGRGRTFVWGDRAIDKEEASRTFGGSRAAKVCCALPEFESITSDSFRIIYCCGGCGLGEVCIACAHKCHIQHCLELAWTLEDTLSRECSCFSSGKCMFDMERGADSGSPDTLGD